MDSLLLCVFNNLLRVELVFEKSLLPGAKALIFLEDNGDNDSLKNS